MILMYLFNNSFLWTNHSQEAPVAFISKTLIWKRGNSNWGVLKSPIFLVNNCFQTNFRNRCYNCLWQVVISYYWKYWMLHLKLNSQLLLWFSLTKVLLTSAETDFLFILQIDCTFASNLNSLQDFDKCE